MPYASRCNILHSFSQSVFEILIAADVFAEESSSQRCKTTTSAPRSTRILTTSKKVATAECSTDASAAEPNDAPVRNAGSFAARHRAASSADSDDESEKGFCSGSGADEANDSGNDSETDSQDSESEADAREINDTASAKSDVSNRKKGPRHQRYQVGCLSFVRSGLRDNL